MAALLLPLIEVLALLLAVAALWGVASLWLARGVEGPPPRARQVLLVLAVVLLAIYGSEWILLANRLEQANGQQRRLYRHVLAGESASGSEGQAIYYQGHHYLDFVLNPAA